MNHRDIQRGALLLVGAALAFASMGAAIKISTGQLHYTQVVFFRSLLSTVGCSGTRLSAP